MKGGSKTIRGGVELQDFMPFYRPISDADFGIDIATNKEFAMNKLTPEEHMPSRQGDLLSQQKLVQHFLSPNTPYDGLLLFHQVGVGKCLDPNTPVLLWDGSVKPARKIQTGDDLIGDDSCPRRVLSICTGTDHMYKICQNRGDAYIVNQPHILTLKYSRHKKYEWNEALHGYMLHWFDAETFDTHDQLFASATRLEALISLLTFSRTISNECTIDVQLEDYLKLPGHVRRCLKGIKAVVDFPGQSTEIDAYIMGTRVGDGTITYIAQEYMINDRDTRLSFLAGVLDTIGQYYRREYELQLPNKAIADQVVYIARSLGFCATITVIQGCFECVISGNGLEQIPCRISILKARTATDLRDRSATHITVEYIGQGPYCGFTLDGNGRFLLEDFTVTHNTCAAIAVGENFKHTLVNGEPRKKALILVKNHVLVDQFIKKIHSECTLDQYGNATLVKEWLAEIEKGRYEEALTEEKIRIKLNRKLQKKVKESYEIFPYETFLNRHDSDILNRKEYSNRIIIVDEIHDMRERTAKKGKKAKENYYARLLRFMTAVQNCRVLLMTATPIWEAPWELSSVFNLLLPPEQRLASTREFMNKFYENGKLINQDVLEERWKGKVSFLRALSTTAEKIEEGSPKPWLKFLHVYPSVLSKYQANIAYAAENEKQIVTTKKQVEGEMVVFKKDVFGGPAWVDARDTLNFVYPKTKGEHVFGKKLFDKLFKTTKKTGVKKLVKGKFVDKTVQDVSFAFPVSFKEEIGPDMSSGTARVSEGLHKYSCKFATIVQMLLDHPKEKVFIHGDLVERGSVPLSLVLELYGFTKLMANITINDATPKSRRFAIMTSLPTTVNNDRLIARMLDTFNSSLNRYGEYIQVIIGSKKLEVGINLKCIRQAHILTPHWNLSKIEQALGRVYRFGSHDQLPESERYIKSFLHVAVYNMEKDGASIDTYTYSKAEEKEYEKLQAYRLLKRISFDCALTYQRNVLPNDVDGSRECDFTDCNYECYQVPPTDTSTKVWRYDYPMVDTNYNVLYSQEEMLIILGVITPLFRSKAVHSLDEIKQQVSEQHPDITDYILLSALDLIINLRATVRNKYGFPCYLKEQGDTYFLETNLEQSPNQYALEVYTQNPIISSQDALRNAVDYLRLERDRKVICSFAEYCTIQNFYKLYYDERIVLLEDAYDQTAKGNKNDVYAFILNEMGTGVYTLSNGMVAHNLYYEYFNGTSYKILVKKYEPQGISRIYKGDHWAFVTDTEQEQNYLAQMKAQKEQRLDDHLNNPYGLYGLFPLDGKFKIRTADVRIRAKKGEVTSSKTKGRACKNIQPAKLYPLIRKTLGTEPNITDEIIDIMVNSKSAKGGVVYQDIREADKKKLKEYIQGNKKYLKMIKGYKQEEVTFNIKDLTVEELRFLAIFLTAPVPEICQRMLRWLVDFRPSHGGRVWQGAYSRTHKGN